MYPFRVILWLRYIVDSALVDQIYTNETKRKKRRVFQMRNELWLFDGIGSTSYEMMKLTFILSRYVQVMELIAKKTAKPKVKNNFLKVKKLVV